MTITYLDFRFCSMEFSASLELEVCLQLFQSGSLIEMLVTSFFRLFHFGNLDSKWTGPVKTNKCTYMGFYAENTTVEHLVLQVVLEMHH
jgi:hypothetical protein